MNFLLGFEENKKLYSSLLQDKRFEALDFRIHRFENNEMQIVLSKDPKDKNCVIVGSIYPPEEHLVAMLMLSHTLKKQGAKTIILVIPYLSYSRHDHDLDLKSFGAKFIGNLFKTSGIDQIVTCDIHSKKAISLFGKNVISISPDELFAKGLKNSHESIDEIIAPDDGALVRAEKLSAHLKVPFQVFQKIRKEDGSVESFFEGSVKEHVVVVDDILDTGKTLVLCVQRLCELGAKKIVIMVTHGLFTGETWKALKNYPVAKVFITSSVEKALPSDLNIEVLDISPQIHKVLCQILSQL